MTAVLAVVEGGWLGDGGWVDVVVAVSTSSCVCEGGGVGGAAECIAQSHCHHCPQAPAAARPQASQKLSYRWRKLAPAVWWMKWWRLEGDPLVSGGEGK